MTNRKFTGLVGKNQLNTHLISAHLQINGKLRNSTIYIGESDINLIDMESFLLGGSYFFHLPLKYLSLIHI